MSKSPREKPPLPEVPAISPKRPRQPVDLEIETALLLEPLNAARETFDEEALADLTISVQQIGLITPLAVEPEGKKYRIHAGHRRFIVCSGLGWKKIPCRVFPEGLCDGEAIKVHENAFRESVNPAHEARYLQRELEERCGGDVDQLCSRLRMKRDYVEGRLLLIQGDAQVFQALSDSAISIGVAQELNKVTDRPARIMYLDAAMQGGASVRMVRDWRSKANAIHQLSAQEVTTNPDTSAIIAPIAIMQMLCFLCDDSSDTYDMELLYVHRRCRKMFLDKFLERLKGPLDATE